MISDEYKVIFIHINKTGGTSISQAFGFPRKHKVARQLKEEVPHKWDLYFKFSFVRNPWDRMLSMYKFRIENNFQIDSNISFKKWLLEVCPKQRENKSFPPLWGPQLEWLEDKEGNILVDYIGRYERIKSDWEKICKKINKKLILPHLNKSNHLPYYKYYDKETKSLVEEWHQKDIAKFGYEFNYPLL